MAESTEFILFMLSAIKEALSEAVNIASTNNLTAKEQQRWQIVYTYLQDNPYITNADVRNILEVSSATANRMLGKFTENGLLEKIHVNGHWAYMLK